MFFNSSINSVVELRHPDQSTFGNDNKKNLIGERQKYFVKEKGGLVMK
jgi:hypothetical protein